jgi:hypothetical protein
MTIPHIFVDNTKPAIPNSSGAGHFLAYQPVEKRNERRQNKEK